MDTYRTDVDPEFNPLGATKVNTMAIVSIVLALFAGAALVLDSAPVVAVFSVGSGHIALQQIKTRDERGEALAYVALGLSYAIALYALAVGLPIFYQTVSEIFTSRPA